ncbi:metallophosphoesterase family protein [Pseudomonas sp. CGJS7]|uniref:metallophosphoesterase family protein n=1 Tax=Pseudomonas sp. CGJS7 TaxID=3109348 RepID=UPI00300A863D
MRIAVLSDIHGNLAALDAVRADIERRGADLIVDLGDLLSGPLQVAETADRLIALGWPTIAGNHERQVLNDPPERMSESDRHAVAHLRADQREWLRKLPASLRLSDEVLMVHGTPRSDLECFIETIDAAGIRAASAAEAAERLGDTDARLILCGHTHVPRSLRLDDGRLIVNPGSVGLQAYSGEHPHPHRVENHSPHARYAIVERHDDGVWTAELLAVDYDWDAAAALALRNGRPDWARALATGRV